MIIRSPRWPFERTRCGTYTASPKLIVDHIPGQLDPATNSYELGPGASMLVPGPLYHSGPLINCLTILLVSSRNEAGGEDEPGRDWAPVEA